MNIIKFLVCFFFYNEVINHSLCSPSLHQIFPPFLQQLFLRNSSEYLASSCSEPTVFPRRLANEMGVKVNCNKAKMVSFNLCSDILSPTFLINDCRTTKQRFGCLVKRLTWDPHKRIKRVDFNQRYKLLSYNLTYTLETLNIQQKNNLQLVINPLRIFRCKVWHSTEQLHFYRIQSKVLGRNINGRYYASK